MSYYKVFPEEQLFEEGIRWWDLHENPYDVYLKHRWNPTTLEEFREAILDDLFPQAYGKIKPGVHTFLHDYEGHISRQAFKDKITNYAPDSFEYYVNDFGFRGKNQPVIDCDDGLGFFGCSFTFGVGLPEEKHFTKIVGDRLGMTMFNFGIPGASSGRTARVFSLVTRFQRLKYAVVMLPNIGRMEYPSEQRDGSTILINMLLNFKHLSEEEEALRQRLFSVLPQRYMAYDTVRSITMIELAAKLAGVKVFYTSWDMPVHNLISSYFRDEQDKIAPWFRFVEHDGKSEFKRARDGTHPGDRSSKLFANNLTLFLEKHID